MRDKLSLNIRILSSPKVGYHNNSLDFQSFRLRSFKWCSIVPPLFGTFFAFLDNTPRKKSTTSFKNKRLFRVHRTHIMIIILYIYMYKNFGPSPKMVVLPRCYIPLSRVRNYSFYHAPVVPGNYLSFASNNPFSFSLVVPFFSSSKVQRHLVHA